MARPQKEGIDYFPLDVDMDHDDKVQLIEAEHGVMGFGIIIKLLMKIYAEGYYYQWSEKEQLLFSKRTNVDINQVNAVINSCIKWGMFDSEVYEKHKILTSSGIQRRYVTATSRRKNVQMIREYTLIDVESAPHIVIVNINAVNVNNNSTHDEFMPEETPQSKVKESKVKESKEYNTEPSGNDDVLILTKDEEKFLATLAKIANYPVDRQKDLEFYHALKERHPTLDLVLAVEQWAAYKLDKPLKPNSNARSQINNAFANYEKWGWCLKGDGSNAKPGRDNGQKGKYDDLIVGRGAKML